MGTVAKLVARYVVQQGVPRVFGLCGGHIQPIWDELARLGIEVVDVRHECAAVHMAQAQADLTGGVGVALVTAGPGLTNAVTGIANAHMSRSSVLVLSGRAPRPQTGRGALQELPQADVVRGLCRHVGVVWDRRQVLAELEASWGAALGVDGPQGPAYVDFPTDLLNESAGDLQVELERLRPQRRSPMLPDPDSVADAAQLVRDASRILVISGRGARGHGEAVTGFLDATGAGYLDTTESRGVVRLGHPAQMTAVRSRAMAESDLVVTLGRRLDFQLAYGSAAIFNRDARWIRIGRSADELADNRRGDATIQADVGPALAALLNAGLRERDPGITWRDGLHGASEERIARSRSAITEAVASDGGGAVHPLALLSVLGGLIDDDTIVIADGGDILSFARSTLLAETWLDPGALGCLGVGVPFAVSAAINFPHRRVVGVIGDGAFGFSCMEVETAVRRGARVVLVVANNAAWNIERHDQLNRYGGHLVGVELQDCRFDQFAQSLGAHGERVTQPAELPAALDRAMVHAPAVVDVVTSREPVSPDTKNGLPIVPDLQALKVWDEAERTRYRVSESF